MNVERHRYAGVGVTCLGALLVLAAVAACSSTGASSSSSSLTPTTSVLQTGADGPVTDYAAASNWLNQPAKADKGVDVFYVYPTAYQKANATAPDIAEVTDAGMRKGAQSAYARQATAFEDIANIYAPYYRQADATYALTLPQAEHVQVIEGAPLIDVTAAYFNVKANAKQRVDAYLAAH